MTTRALLSALVLNAALCSFASATSTTKGVWMISGKGPTGDCLGQFALRWDDSWEPGNGNPCTHPVPSGSGQDERIFGKQVCTDGKGCDRDGDGLPNGESTPNGRCTFEVGVCFCVDDPSRPDCSDVTRPLWCDVAGSTPLPPKVFVLKKPSRKEDGEAGAIRCKLEREIRGCFLDMEAPGIAADYAADDDCCGNGPNGTSSGPGDNADCTYRRPAETCPSPDAAPPYSDLLEHTQDVMTILAPEQVAEVGINLNKNKTRFRTVATAAHNGSGSPLHRLSDFVTGSDGNPGRPYSNPPWQKQFVSLSAYDSPANSCSPRARFEVKVGEPLVLKAGWDTVKGVKNWDKGGGYQLRLECVAEPPPECTY